MSLITLVNFTLNQKDKTNVDKLLEIGLMSLFDSFSETQASNRNLNDKYALAYDYVVKTNIAYLFFALCKNKIQSQVMLEKAITRDMFLVACDLKYRKIRHLVISGFALLGRYDGYNINTPIAKLRSDIDDDQLQLLEKLKSEATYRFQKKITEDTVQNIHILLKFSASDDLQYQIFSLKSLRDLVILYGKKLGVIMEHICRAFTVGCISESEEVQTVSINALSFLITNKLVYKSHEETQEDPPSTHVEAQVPELKKFRSE